MGYHFALIYKSYSDDMERGYRVQALSDFTLQHLMDFDLPTFTASTWR